MSCAHVVLLGAANSVHLQRWAIALHEQGRQVSVISQHAHLALPLPGAIKLHALPVRSGLGYLANVPALRALLRQIKPDLLHAHYASGYGTLGRLARFRPYLLSVWGSDVYEFPTRSAWHAWWLRGNLRVADALASTSQAMAEQVRRLWPQAGAITVTPFGVDMQVFCPAPDAARNIVSTFTIGTVKSLAPAYGIDTLIEAFARFRQHDLARPCRLLIVGEGPERAALQALCASHGVAAEVEFAGAVAHQDVPQFLRQLDIYVAASRSESFGVAVVEAMACGVPVVVSDAGGLPEVVGHGACGVIVPRDDAAALADALNALMQNDNERTRLATAGRAHAQTHYTWPNCVQRMLQCQDSVVAAI